MLRSSLAEFIAKHLFAICEIFCRLPPRYGVVGTPGLLDKEIVVVGGGSWRRCRIVVLLGVLVVLVAAVAVPAFADGGVQHEAGEGPVDWDAIEPPDMSRMFTSQAYMDSAAQALAQMAAAEREHDSVDERQARDASESTFADLSGASAQDLAQREFPELMGEDLDALAVPAGSHVKSYLSPTVARVVDSRGKGSLLVGSKPLAAQDASGDLQAIDLTLQSSGDAYVPADPAADVSIPHAADDYLQLGDRGLGLRPSDAPATAGMREDDRVFYPEVDTDTDFISMPTRTGAEVMWQLRSAAAGEELALDLDLPDGASARLTSALTAPVGQTASPAAAAVEVVRDGAVIDTISPPMAADADGVSVAASYRLDGDRVVVAVPHRALDVKYPIIVDPDVVETYAGVDFSGNCAGGGWYIQSWGQRMNTYCNDTSRGGGGLWIQSNNQAYDNDSRTQWVWSVPNYVHIDSVWIDGVWVHSSGTHMYAGIVGPSGRWNSPPLNLGDDRMNDQFRMDASNGADNMNSFAMGLYEDCCWGGTPRPSIAWAGFNGVQISLGDGVAPWGVRLWDSSQNIVVAPMEGYGVHFGTSRWIRSDGTYTLNLDAHDDGLGLKGVGTGKMVPRSTWDLANDTGLDNAILSGAAPNTCTGNRAGPCPMSATPVGQPLNLSSQRGIIGLHTFATDIVGNSGHGDAYFVKVDHDPPNVIFGQPDTNNYTGDVHNQNEVVGPNPAINVKVTDGDRTVPGTYQSGVRAVITLLDGQNYGRGWSNSNPDATNNDYTWGYHLSGLAAGPHTLTIEAWDDVGRYTPLAIRFTVTAYPTSWNYGGGDRSVNTDLERNAVWQHFSPTDEVGVDQMTAGLSPTDAAYVTSLLTPATSDDGTEESGNTTAYIPPDNGQAGAASEFACYFDGEPYGNRRRPWPPYLSATVPIVSVYAAGEAHCDSGRTVTTNVKVCLQKWFPSNRVIGWLTIACDDESFPGTGPFTKTIRRGCTGGNAYRRYRTQVTLTVISYGVIDPWIDARRSSRYADLPCRAG